MNQMKQESIVIERVYNAPIQKVWKALTDNSQMKEWYFDLEEFKPDPGFEFSFYGQGKQGEKYLHLCKITEVIPGKKLQYSWKYDQYEGNSFVTFELFEEGTQTRLKLTHEGLETFPADNPGFAKENFIEGWTHITGISLREFVENATISKTTRIQSTPEKIWDILTNHEKNIKWASAFYEGTYVETDWKQGSEVLWKTPDGSVGAKGKVVEHNTGENLKIAFWDDVQMSDPQPTGEYYESYSITKENGASLLTIHSGPLSMKYCKSQEPLWDKALQKIKDLAEN